MQATVAFDESLRVLLQRLLTVRHPHLRPLTAVRANGRHIFLHYGQTPLCRPGCEGVLGAVHRLHDARLWVGDLAQAVTLESGRAVLSGIGRGWSLVDPFAGHPAATGSDIRLRWRQRADLVQMSHLDEDLLRCG